MNKLTRGIKRVGTAIATAPKKVFNAYANAQKGYYDARKAKDLEYKRKANNGWGN